MKTVFIINPKAGKNKNIESFVEKLENEASKAERDIEIYITKAVGDATEFVKDYCDNRGPARFIACGGDGTFNEVLNGAIGFCGAEIGVFPMGTGNDFCRNFGDNLSFKDILSQIDGKSEKCDVIRYCTEVGGEKKQGYCANMFNIGFDCNVADTTSDIKKNKFIFGPFAYFVSILVTLIKKKTSVLKIELDGDVRHEGRLLLTAIANGSYCGGGIKSNPLASVNDGLININIIKNISRLNFICLLPYYMKGNFLELRNIEKYILSEKCKKVTVTPLEGKMRLCIDGEITDAGKTEFEIVHDAFDFVVPKVKEEDVMTVGC